MEIIIVGIVSYLMGSIPFGFILTKFFLKKDIRDIGSGNIGATNALRTGNKSLGYGTLFLDVIKAVIPVIYVKLNYPDYIFIAAARVGGILENSSYPADFIYDNLSIAINLIYLSYKNKIKKILYFG